MASWILVKVCPGPTTRSAARPLLAGPHTPQARRRIAPHRSWRIDAFILPPPYAASSGRPRPDHRDPTPGRFYTARPGSRTEKIFAGPAGRPRNSSGLPALFPVASGVGGLAGFPGRLG